MTDARDSAAVLLRLAEISQELLSEAALDDVLKRIMDAAIEVTGAERGFLCLNQGGGLSIAMARNLDQEEVRNARRKLSQAIIQRVISSGEPMIATDAVTDERLLDSVSIHDMKIHSAVCIPLKLKPTTLTSQSVNAAPEVIGCVYLDHRFTSGQFEDTDLETLNLFGAHAALALRNAQYVELLKQRNAQLNSQLENAARTLVQTRMQLEDARSGRAVETFDVPGIVYASRVMHEMLDLVRRVADQDLTILISGESGTGKERLARAIHAMSRRASGPFVAVNCGAIPPELFESELFGHRRGSFTGADRDHMGLIESAERGTLLLDEVADLAPQHQVKLLRVLQEGEIRRVGESVPRKVDVRVLSATNKDLDTEVREGRFREDLYYRLRVFHVEVPPLRDRPEDIPLLADEFIRQRSGQLPVRVPSATEAAQVPTEAKRGAIEVEADVYSQLTGYGWPGNIRELENEVLRALALGGSRITCAELSAHIRSPVRAGVFDVFHEKAHTLDEMLSSVEREIIVQALETYQYNKSQTARALGISRNGLALKMTRLGIDSD